jgi:hypothetical protein
MGMTPEQLRYVRSEVGSDEPPTDADLNALYDQLSADTDDAVNATITRVLNDKLSALLNQPDSFAVPGQYSESNGRVITALEKKVARFESTAGGSLVVGKLDRADRHRRIRGPRRGDERILP